MRTRGFALFLVFVLLWSALSTIEAPRAFAQAMPAQQSAMTLAGGGMPVDEGSVAHHHLDDLPLQTHSDTLAESPGLLPTPLRHSEPLLVMARAPAFSAAATGPPCLAGPLRPPCSAARTG